MSDEERAISIHILGKEYLIACDEREQALLKNAATLLNDKMSEIKNSGKIIGSERITVLAALNIAYELLDYKKSKEDYSETMEEVMQRLKNKVDQALATNIRNTGTLI